MRDASGGGETLAARLERAAQRVQEAVPGEREAVRQEIVALYRDVESELTRLAAMQEQIKSLVERWKQAAVAVPAATPPAVPVPPPAGVQASPPDTAPAAAPAASAAAPPAAAIVERPAVTDHLGASTFIEKGWNLISLADYAGAERALQRALQLAPRQAQAESLLGWAQMLQEHYDEALLTFQKVLLHEPANSLARVNLGYICLKRRIFGEAIEHLSRAIRMNNDRKATLYAHFYLGLVYSEREMYADAEAFFRQSLALGPNLIEAWFELGRALWFDGRNDDAVEAWREGHKANKFNPWGKRCGEMLALVGSGGAPSRAG